MNKQKQTEQTDTDTDNPLTVELLTDILEDNSAALYASHRCQMDCRVGNSIFPRGFYGAEKDVALAMIEDKWYTGGRNYFESVIDSYTEFIGSTVCDKIERRWQDEQ
jgi:hypothetical protein